MTTLLSLQHCKLYNTVRCSLSPRSGILHALSRREICQTQDNVYTRHFTPKIAPVTRPQYELSCKHHIFQTLRSPQLHSLDLNQAQLCVRTLATEANKKKKSKVKKMLKEYGPVFLCFHLFTSCVTYGIFYTLVSRGFDTSYLISLADAYTDVDAILAKADYSRSVLLSSSPSASSNAVIALLLYKLSGPIRLFLDSLAVPFLVRFLRQLGVMEPVNPVNEAQAEMVLSRIEALGEKYERIDVKPMQRAIRRQVQGRKDRRTIQLLQYADTQRKIDKVFWKKSTKGGPRVR